MVLPDPLSPTMPSVSPRRSAKETPSTARTARRRPERSPPRAAKVLVRPSARITSGPSAGARAARGTRLGTAAISARV